MEAQTVQDILAEVGVQLASPEDYAALAAKYPDVSYHDGRDEARERGVWIVTFEGEKYGPFENEDACYAFAARVSKEANDWTPEQLLDPATAEDGGKA